jgi:hypothetical protein
MFSSRRARVNGLMFLLVWVVVLAVVSGIAYAASDQANAATGSTIADAIAWVKIVFGGEHAKAELDEMKNWLALHNNAVVAVCSSSSVPNSSPTACHEPPVAQRPWLRRRAERPAPGPTVSSPPARTIHVHPGEEAPSAGCRPTAAVGSLYNRHN